MPSRDELHAQIPEPPAGLAALDALETRRCGPEPENVTLADYDRAVPEA